MAGAGGAGAAVTPSRSHRDDIDGLRALAVIPVCLFHAGVRVLPGGFVGVDVFFVISGFLMCRLISAALDDGSFTFLWFYERRARRILPALLVTLAVALALAVQVAPPKLFTDTAVTAAAAAMFAANVGLWRGAAHYFDAPAEWNPLLHTWSLSVEEQFYLVFPVVLWAVHRLAPRARVMTVVAMGVVSFAINIVGTAMAPTAAFYLLPGRAWELLLGAAVAAAASARDSGRENHAAPGLAGLLLIAGSMVWFDRTIAFPGWAAAAPAVGTALLLSRPGLVARGLAWTPLVAIGRWSYSIYLWHWPVIVFGWKYGLLGAPSVPLALALAGATLVIAWASWQWIEQPIRLRQLWPDGPTLGAWTLSASALIAAAGLSVAWSDGRPSRLPGFLSMSIEPQLDADEADPAWQAHSAHGCFVDTSGPWRAEDCRLGGPGPAALVVGDSFAHKLVRGFAGAGGVPLAVLDYTAPQCAPVPGYHPPARPQCADYSSAIPDLVRRHGVTTVVMAANWSAHLGRRGLTTEDIAGAIASLHAAGARVVLVGQGPIFPYAYPDEYRYRIARTADDLATLSAPARLYPDVNTALSGAGADAFIDPVSLFCEHGDCRYRAGGQYLFMDYGHVTAAGARLVAHAIRQAVATDVAR